MNVQQREHPETGHRAYSFAIGLLTGTFVGAGLALWFAPRLAAELRERVTGSARDLGQRVTDGYDQVTTRMAKTSDDLAQKGQDIRDEVADAVAHGAREVERYAKAAKTR